MSWKVISTSPTFGHYVQDPVDYLQQHGCRVEITPQGRKLGEEDLIDAVADVDAMIVGVEKITKGVIEAAKRLKVIAKHGAGVDNIDMEAATEQGVVVTSAPGANSDAVADLTFGLFLALARAIPVADRSVKNRTWPRIVGRQLAKKTLGIIGMGQIGRKVALRAHGFGMKAVAYDVVTDEKAQEEFRLQYVPLERLLETSDFVSIHVPLTPGTRHMIGKRELEKMKETAYLVNIARGGVVDESALYDALRSRKISGAAVDVFEREPPGDHPLLELENFIATPHMGGYTFEALSETGFICAKAIIDVLEGRRPEYVNNVEVLERGAKT